MSATNRFLTCAFFALLVGGCVKPDDEAGKEPGPLEGKWKLTLMTSGGNANQVIKKELSLLWQLCPTEEILDDQKRVRGFTEYLLTVTGDKMVVKSLFADVEHHKAGSGLIVTTSSFSKGARETCVARSYPIREANRDTVAKWITRMRTPNSGVFLGE